MWMTSLSSLRAIIPYSSGRKKRKAPNSGSNSSAFRSHFAWWLSYCSPGYAVIPDIDGSILGNVKSVKLPWQIVQF